jgi:hypothetical protein
MAQIATESPSFATGTPSVMNSEDMLSFSLPIINTGGAPASNVVVTDITLGSTPRIGPVLPLLYEDIEINSVKQINAGFSNRGLIVGRSYLATIRGLYEANNLTLRFALNRPIVVPAPIVSPLNLLKAQIDFNFNPGNGLWSYSLLNREPAGSPRFISSFSLDIDSPFSVASTPPGWSFQTNGLSYIAWFTTDQGLPYPNHIAPGSSQTGFQIQSQQTGSESKGVTINSWNHQLDKADLVTFGSVLTPSSIL